VLLQVVQGNKKGNFEHFEIVARHFFYLTEKLGGGLTDHAIFVVKKAPNTPEMNFRE